MAETAVTAPVTEATTTETTTAAAPQITLADLEDPKKLVEFLKGKKVWAKVNGKEDAVTFDDLHSGYQKVSAAEQRFQEAAKTRQEAAQEKAEAAKFKANPWQYLADHGVNPYQAAEQLLMQQMQYDKLTPEQKALAQREMEAQHLKSELQQERDERKRLEMSAVEAQVVPRIDEEIAGAVEQSALVASPEVIALVAANMLTPLEGGQRRTAAQAVAMTHNMVNAAAKAFLGQVSIPELQAILPKQVLDGLRKADVEKALAQSPHRRPQASKEQPTVVRRQPMTTDQAFDQLEQRYAKRK